ncbi:hypothetical protein N9A49_00620 [Salibacteraceae bacterium]|jgi:hypothetical protein|nr:hypothetical protein [Salibacteraceae bacterium]HAQ70868.1 hypothetical protein [Flavobacteriales bacterium]MDB0002301.1 hypothetical protein [Salibacteraceae bacterium]MDB4105433.1 hypothetical protein [Salibacteraceae bacterium]MDB9708533.1 hypothetical protein [Salibacteraceae bacterium]
MIYRFIILCAILIFSFSIPARAEVQAIEHLLISGKLNLDISSLGSHRENCIRVIATNLSNEALFTRIEPGRILVSNDINVQDIIVTQEMIIALAPKDEVTKQAFGFCCQNQNSGPSEGTNFKLGKMSSYGLLDIAKYLNKHRELNGDVQQHAIWVMSDCSPISSISQYDEESQELVRMISDNLGVKAPWYITEHRLSADQLFSKKVDRIRGKMDFKVSEYDKIKVIVMDQNNRVIKIILSPTVYGPGNYQLPLDLFVNFWESGDYNVVFQGEKGDVIGSYDFTI